MSVSLTFANTTAFLAIGREDCPANLFDSATLAGLSERLDELAAEPHVTGLLIRSAKPGIFSAGADLREFPTAGGERIERLTAAGQTLFNRIADLPFPTVAAIHGPCLGGGYELALACDWRIASDDPSTEIGLPQTPLGLLPAWGGTTRLPDLLGLPDALPLILSGKILPAAEAKRKGLVDEAVPVEHLKAYALGWLARGKRHHSHNPIVHNQAVAALIRAQSQRELMKNPRGHRPAREAALEVAVASIGRSRTESQQAERGAIARLAVLPETANLLRLHFLRERAEGRHTEAAFRAIRRAAVFGAGATGSGIAWSLGARGTETILQDISHEALADGMKSIADLRAEGQDLDPLHAARGLDRIHPACGKIPLVRCDLIFEASEGEIPERREILADLTSRCRPDAVLAVCSPGIPIRSLAASVPNPERVVGLNFFQSVQSAVLVEVVRTDFTSAGALAAAVAFVRGIGKLPVVVRDSPGFLVSRILMPYLVKAVSLFEQGGDPEEIDRAMLDFGMPMGPLRLLDEMGLDHAMRLAHILAREFPDRMEIPRVVGKLLEGGHSGRKDGSGFYVHDQTPPAVNAEVIAFQTGSEGTPADTRDILAEALLSEAGRCLAEGLADDAEDIELAIILGLGYPAFRGGAFPGHAP